MIRTRARMAVCICLISCILCFIWGNSLLPAEVSQAFSDWVLEVLKSIFAGLLGGAGEGGGFLRKLAHFTEFAALGVCLGWLFGMLKRSGAWALLTGAAAGCVDETIQLFVPNRGPGILDVCIDTAGVTAGILLLYLGYAFYKKKKINYPVMEVTQQ